MSSAQGPTPVLQYATPRVFLRAKVRRHTVENLLASLMFAVFGVFWTLGLLSRSQFGPFFLNFIPLVFFAFSGLVLWSWLGERNAMISITEDGITRKRTYWSWEKIHRLHATASYKGVDLLFQMHGGMGSQRLDFAPRLTPAQYAALAKLLNEHVVPKFAKLEIYPQAGG
jgi:hypothetical protein